jgi:hypothetical protein
MNMANCLRRAVRYAPLLYILAPTIALAQFGGLVPCGVLTATDCNLCDFGRLIQNVINFLVVISIPIAALLFCYAGFLFFTNNGSQMKIQKAKRIMYASVVGFIIVCAAWLIVNTILMGLTNGSAYSGGKWFILNCTSQTRPMGLSVGALFNPQLGTNSGAPGGGPVVVPGGGTGGGSAGTQVCTTSSCSPNQILQAAQAAGINMTSAQANALSCIAQTESSGNPIASNGTAVGTFQFVPSTWTSYATGSCAPLDQRTNYQCQLQTAMTAFQTRGFGDWTCPGCNNNAQTCIRTFGA